MDTEIETDTTAAAADAALQPEDFHEIVRQAVAAQTARLATGYSRIEVELEYLIHHLEGIRLAARGIKASGCEIPPEPIIALVDAAQDRVRGIIIAAEKVTEDLRAHRIAQRA